jgi:hypothetical protein
MTTRRTTAGGGYRAVLASAPPIGAILAAT